MNKNQKGFTAVEGLLIIIIVVLVGFVGWYVLSNKHKNTVLAPVKSTSNTDITAKSDTDTSQWETYSDRYVSFKHPKDWIVKQTGEGVYGLDISGPNDTTIIPIDNATNYKKLYLNFSISTQGLGVKCSDQCKIHNIDSVKLASGKTKQLIYSELQSQGYTEGFTVNDISDAKVGDTSYTYLGIDNKVRIDGTIMGDSASFIQLKDDSTYPKIESIKVFKVILSTLTIK